MCYPATAPLCPHSLPQRHVRHLGQARARHGVPAGLHRNPSSSSHLAAQRLHLQQVSGSGAACVAAAAISLYLSLWASPPDGLWTLFTAWAYRPCATLASLATCAACATLSSALNDRRFVPIERSELASLDVSVSLLVKYEPAQHWEDWEVCDDAPTCVVRWCSTA